MAVKNAVSSAVVTLKEPRHCAIRGVLDRIGDKWSFLLVLNLAERPHGFGELRREINDISQRMLTETLRSLQRDGLVDREVFATRPPSVEYRLTKLGESLLEPMQRLVAWADVKQPAIRRAREKFDAGPLAKRRAQVDVGAARQLR